MKKIMICIAVMAMCATTAVAQETVKNVEVENRGQKAAVVYADGDKTGFTDRNSADLSFEENLAISKGERKAYNVRHTGLDGRALKRTSLSALAGVALVDKSIAPQMNIGISHSFVPSVDFGLQLGYTRAKFDDEAVAEGWYNSLEAMVTAEGTIMQTSAAKYTADGSKLKLGVAAGAAFQKTEDLDLEKVSGSQGYGFCGKMYLKGEINIATNAYLLFEGGVKMLPQFDLDKLKSGEEKLAQNLAPYLQLGFAVRF